MRLIHALAAAAMLAAAPMSAATAFVNQAATTELPAQKTGIPQWQEVKFEQGDVLSRHPACAELVPVIKKVYGLNDGQAMHSCWQAVVTVNPTVTNYNAFVAGTSYWLPVVGQDLAAVEAQMTYRKDVLGLAADPNEIAHRVIQMGGDVADLKTRVADNAGDIRAVAKVTGQNMFGVADLNGRVGAVEGSVNDLWTRLGEYIGVVIVIGLIAIGALVLGGIALLRSRKGVTEGRLVEAIAPLATTAALEEVQATANAAVTPDQLAQATDPLATKAVLEEVTAAVRAADAKAETAQTVAVEANRRAGAALQTARAALDLVFGDFKLVGDLPKDAQFERPENGVLEMRFVKIDEPSDSRTVRFVLEDGMFRVDGVRNQRNLIGVGRAKVLKVLKGAFASNRVEGVDGVHQEAEAA